MDLTFPISHPLEFFVYVFAPAWTLLIVLKHSSPSIRKRLEDIEKDISILGKPLDNLLIISLLGISFNLFINLSFILLGLIIVNSPLSPTPKPSLELIQLILSHSLGILVWLVSSYIIFSILNRKYDITKKLILRSTRVLVVPLFFFLHTDNPKLDRNIYLFFVVSISLIFTVVYYLLLSSIFLGPDIIPLKYLIPDDNYPFVFYANCSCNDTTMVSSFYLLNNIEKPLIFYWVKQDPQDSIQNLDSRLPKTLAPGDGITSSFNIPRYHWIFGHTASEWIVVGTSEGTYPIPLKCDSLNVNTPSKRSSF